MNLTRSLATLSIALFSLSASADILVSGQNTATIFRFSDTGTFIDKLIGPGEGLVAPVGMRVGPDGKLYIGDQGNGKIHRYDFATDQLTLFAQTNFAPTDIQFTGDGRLLASDYLGTQVFQFDVGSGNNLGAFTTGGSMIQPTNMLLDGGFLYVSSLGTAQVQRFNATTGAFVDVFVSAGSGGLTFPAGLQFGPDDNLYVSSLFNHEIIRFDASASAPIPPLNPVPWLNTPDQSFPSDILFVGDKLLIATTGGFGVLKYDGTNLTTFAFHPDLQIAGQLLSVSIVPEASSLVLATGGAILMAGICLRRRRSIAD